MLPFIANYKASFTVHGEYIRIIRSRSKHLWGSIGRNTDDTDADGDDTRRRGAGVRCSAGPIISIVQHMFLHMFAGANTPSGAELLRR